MNNVLSVIQLNTYIKRLFEKDFVLKNVTVEGELSNFKRHSSGHIYFTLKDDKAQVSCVLFRSYLDGSERQLHDGAKVVVNSGTDGVIDVEQGDIVGVLGQKKPAPNAALRTDDSCFDQRLTYRV